MAKYFNIHPDNPQERLLLEIINYLNKNALIAIPTDCSYAMCCSITSNTAIKKLQSIKRDESSTKLALLMPDIATASQYAKLDDKAFRLLKKATPGPYTFILPVNTNLPKRLHDKRKTIGIRIVDNPIVKMLLNLYGEPLYSSTLWENSQQEDEDVDTYFPLFEPETIQDKLGSQLDVIIDGGKCFPESSTIVSLLDDNYEIIRHGRGDINIF